MLDVKKLLAKIANQFITTTVSDLTLTKTSGASTASVQSAAIKGGDMILTLSFSTTSAISSGSNVWVGSITQSKYRPKRATAGVGYNGGCCVVVVVATNGGITARATGASLSSGSVPWVYVTFPIS